MSVKFERDTVQNAPAPGERKAGFMEQITQTQTETKTKNASEGKTKPGYLAVCCLAGSIMNLG